MRYRSNNRPGYSSTLTYTHYTADDITEETYEIPFTVEEFSPRCWEHDNEGGGIELGQAVLTDFVYDDGETTTLMFGDLSLGKRQAIEARFNYEMEHNSDTYDHIVEAIADEPAPEDDYPDY